MIEFSGFIAAGLVLVAVLVGAELLWYAHLHPLGRAPRHGVARRAIRVISIITNPAPPPPPPSVRALPPGREAS